MVHHLGHEFDVLEHVKQIRKKSIEVDLPPLQIPSLLLMDNIRDMKVDMVLRSHHLLKVSDWAPSIMRTKTGYNTFITDGQSLKKY